MPLPPDLRSVRIDPGRHVQQTSRVRDTWPIRYDWTAASAVDSINLSQGILFAAGWLTLRRQYDTHNLFLGSLYNSRSDLVAAEVGYLRKEGPLLDGWTRPLRLRFDVGASLLDPAFARTDGLQIALDSTLSVTHDNRVSYDFPLRGHRLVLAAGAGGIPGADARWLSASGSASAVASPHPRFAASGRLTAAWADSELPHRLLILGGEGSMRSIPALSACEIADVASVGAGESDTDSVPCFPVASERLHGAFELRVAALRGLSVPLGLLWGSELQISAGIEGLAARLSDAQHTPALATGATLGVLALGDVLGADSAGIGVLAAWPLLWRDLPLSRGVWPELYLRFGQSW